MKSVFLPRSPNWASTTRGWCVLTTADSSSDSMCLALGFPRNAFNRHTALVMGYQCYSALECSPAAR